MYIYIYRLDFYNILYSKNIYSISTFRTSLLIETVLNRCKNSDNNLFSHTVDYSVALLSDHLINLQRCQLLTEKNGLYYVKSTVLVVFKVNKIACSRSEEKADFFKN